MDAVGLTGTVDQVGDAQRWAIMGPRFRVGSDTDLKPTASTTTNLTIDIAAGLGMCCGVFGSQTASSGVTVQANTSGSNRLDTIVQRFTWANPGDVELAVVKGNSPTTPVAPTWTPGATYGAVLGYVLVRSGVGLIQADDVYDTRVWAGIGGAFHMPDGPYRTYADLPTGAVVEIAGIRFTYTGYGNSLASGPGASVGFYAYSNTPKYNIPINTWTTVVMDTATTDQLGAFGSGGFICPRIGEYQISSTVGYTPGDGASSRGAGFTIDGSLHYQAASIVGAGNSDVYVVSGIATIHLGVGTLVRVAGFSSQGNVTAAAYRSSLTVTYVSP